MTALDGTSPLSAVKEPTPAPAEAAQAESPVTTEGPASQTIEGESKVSPKDTTPPDTEQVRFLTLDDVPEEHRPYVESLLKERERQMMAAYTRKTQDIAKEKQKIDAYNMFEKAPEATIRQIAQQMGFDVVPRGQQVQAQPGMVDTANWEPQTWDEVLVKAKEQARESLMAEIRPLLEPLYANLQQVKSQGIENQLSQIDENWRIYEDEIKSNMEFIKPDLLKTAEGIKKLYRMSVPDDVFTSKATQAAIKQYEQKVKSAQIESKSKVNKTSPSIGKINSYDDAVKAAKKALNLI
jgi:hypothetical protein